MLDRLEPPLETLPSVTLDPSAPCKMKIISGVPFNPIVGGVFACLFVFGDGLGTTRSGQTKSRTVLVCLRDSIGTGQSACPQSSCSRPAWWGRDLPAGSCFESPVSQAGDGPPEVT